jgi:pullulanase
MPRIFSWLLAWMGGAAIALAAAEPVVLTPDHRAIPGLEPTPWLLYENPAATAVSVCGSWDTWGARHPMTLRPDRRWALDVRPLAIRFGRHEYKFIVNETWEPGDNRILFVDAEGMLEVPSPDILQASIEDWQQVRVVLRRSPPDPAALRVRLEPELPVQEWKLADDRAAGLKRGYMITGDRLTFQFEESLYGLSLPPSATVSVAGNFNRWDSGVRNPRWRMQDHDDDGIWQLSGPLAALRPPPGEDPLLFKFVVNGQQWLHPPPDALNAVADAGGHRNLLIEPAGGGRVAIEIQTAARLDPATAYAVVIEGLAARPVYRMLTPEGLFDALHSDKELGAQLDRGQRATTYRLFAPRARRVFLCFYDAPYYERHKPAYQRLPPAEKYPMWKDPADGVWELSFHGLDAGRYYGFLLDGPEGDGEAFNPEAPFGDPYARAAAHAENNSIVIDPEETNQWFDGWSDHAYQPPAIEDVIIYEAHVRDLTIHPSSGVPPPLRGRYEGLLASEGTGTGLDHLRDLGVNMIELLPVAEFNNGVNEYNWGYTTTHFFAPEASYGRAPLTGSQYFEFKRLVDQLHRKGFGVILDVVYNHVGSPNVFNLIDKKYYFRLNPDYTFSNFSGVGNDVRSESPMMRRLIVDNILYWMREHKVDGFRLDLAELIDMDTMMAIRDAALRENPRVLLISEPWSFRGENKHQLRGTGWSAWNNDFRYAAKDFVMNTGDRERLRQVIFGSVETWAANPRQPVNYVESHDDMALADELSTAPRHDGRILIEADVKANRLAATILFTSLGIPMLAEGQEFLRSKHGINNTYNRGDAVNALNWADRERPLAAEALAYYRGLMRLRLSPEGAAFRVAERPPASYFQWIRPPEHRALGYIVNAPRVHKGNSFIVLLNAAGQETTFNVAFPPGRWKQIGNGRTIEPKGLPGAERVPGPRQANLTVPPISSAIYMDGF